MPALVLEVIHSQPTELELLRHSDVLESCQSHASRDQIINIVLTAARLLVTRTEFENIKRTMYFKR